MFETLFTRSSKTILIAFFCTLPFAIWASADLLKTNANRVEDWFPPGRRETKELKWFQHHFQGDEVLVVSWEGCTLDDSRLIDLADHAKRLVDDHGHPIFRRVLTGHSVFQRLVDDGLDEQTVRERLEGWLLGSDGSTTCAILMVDSRRSPDRRLAVAEVTRIAKEVCQLEPSQLKVGGPTADSVFIDRVSVNSLYVLSAISLVVGISLAWIFLRDWSMVGATFLTALFTQFYILTLVQLSGDVMDAVLTMVPLLVYILTICACIHFLNSYREALARPTLQNQSAPIVALSLAWRPTLLAGVTTAIGLATLMSSELLPIRKFGFFGAVGILVSMPVLFVFQTAFLTVFPAAIREQAAHDRSRLRSALERLSQGVMAHHRIVLVISFLVAAVSGYGGTRIQASAKIRDMFTERSKELKDYRWLEEKIGPLVPIDVVLCFDADDENNMFERTMLTEQVRARVASVPFVSGVSAPSTFLPEFRDRDNIRGAFRRSVANSRLKRRRESLLSESLIAESDDEELWLVSGRVPVFSPVDYGKILKQVDETVGSFLASRDSNRKTNMRVVVTGGVPLVNAIQTGLLKDLQVSLGLTILSIGIVLAIGLRSIGAALILLIPNVLPAILIFGTMGWTGVSVDLGSMLTVATAIGVSVDNELHFIAHFRRQLAESTNREDAIIKTMQHCRMPILHAGLICSLGMLVLVLSPFLPTVRFGLIMFLLISTAMIGDLIVLPAILKSRLGRVF